jgi:hypothetical protein
MANEFTPAPEAKQPYTYERYPLVMHRGQYPHIESRQAKSAEDEASAREAGWSTEAPTLPPPPEEKPPLTIEQRVAALEEKFAALDAKRGPGRPRKEE